MGCCHCWHCCHWGCCHCCHSLVPLPTEVPTRPAAGEVLPGASTSVAFAARSGGSCATPGEWFGTSEHGSIELWIDGCHTILPSILPKLYNRSEEKTWEKCEKKNILFHGWSPRDAWERWKSGSPDSSPSRLQRLAFETRDLKTTIFDGKNLRASKEMLNGDLFINQNFTYSGDSPKCLPWGLPVQINCQMQSRTKWHTPIIYQTLGLNILVHKIVGVYCLSSWCHVFSVSFKFSWNYSIFWVLPPKQNQKTSTLQTWRSSAAWMPPTHPPGSPWATEEVGSRRLRGSRHRGRCSWRRSRGPLSVDMSINPNIFQSSNL